MSGEDIQMKDAMLFKRAVSKTPHVSIKTWLSIFKVSDPLVYQGLQ
jgi:hypothetical protein